MRKMVLIALMALLLVALPGPDLAAGAAVGLVDPDQTYTYEMMCADLAELEEAYPELIASFSLGTSVDGRELVGFCLGRGSFRQAIICAAMHGREYVTTAFVMYMTDSYCQGYAADSSWQGISYREALDQTCFYIVPMLNPDGVALAQFGLDSVSESRRAYVSSLPILDGTERGWAAWKSNINGVDLNRNFPHKWGLKIKADQPASWEYIGPFAASEPETQAMQSLLDQVDYDMLVSLHSMGEVIYWLDTDTRHLYDQHYPLAQRFSRAFGYRLMPVEDVSASGGFMVNSERVKKGKFSMTVELSDSLYNPDFDRIAGQCYGLGLIMADEMIQREAAPPRVSVNGVQVFFPDQQPLIREGRTLVPLRPVLEACGCDVQWDEVSRSARVSRDNVLVLLTPDQPQLVRNGQAISLEVPPQIINDCLMLPLRAVAEAFGYQVSWDQDSRQVSLSN